MGCSSTSNSQKADKEVEGTLVTSRSSSRLNGRATGKPVVIYNEVVGWNVCATPSISYEHNLEHKADMKPLRDVSMPKWGLPFDFEALHYYESMNDGYNEYYIVTSAYAISETPGAECFELVFEKPHTEKMCDSEKITHRLKKWLLPNRVTLKDPQKIIKAASRLPMTLAGCFDRKNLDISLRLKEIPKD